MPPFKSDATGLTIVVGSELLQGYIWQVDGVAQSLAGYTAEAQVRKRAGGELILDLTPHITLEPDGVTGRILIAVPASVTGAVTARASTEHPAKWDLKLIPAGQPDSAVRLIEGDVTIDPAVTVDA